LANGTLTVMSDSTNIIDLSDRRWRAPGRECG
jgi:hypothetical protein